jgi:hypothetical protein
MKEGHIIQPDKIHLVRLQTLKGTINNEVSTGGAPVKEFDFNFDASIGVNANDKVIGVKFSVDIEALGPNKEKLSLAASYTHELLFVIDNLDEFTDPVEGAPEPKVDRLMLSTLVGIAYSTVRGIVYTRTQGTELKGILLPVIDPKKLLKPEEPAQTPKQNNV